MTVENNQGIQRKSGLQKQSLETQRDPQLSLRTIVCHLKNAIDDIEEQCLSDYKHLLSRNIPLVDGMPYPSPYDILLSVQHLLDVYEFQYSLHESPRHAHLVDTRL